MRRGWGSGVSGSGHDARQHLHLKYLYCLFSPLFFFPFQRSCMMFGDGFLEVYILRHWVRRVHTQI